MQVNETGLSLGLSNETEIIECPHCQQKNKVIMQKDMLMRAKCGVCGFRLIENEQAEKFFDDVEVVDTVDVQYDLPKYADDFSEDSFWNKIVKFAKKAGSKVVYAALLMYYTLQKESTPWKAKAIIIGALGYFISPIDLIPDVIPVVGYTDDLGALLGALVVVAMHIDKACIQQAREKIRDWFGDECADDLAFIESKIAK